jgi:hypothetical protein
VNGLETSEYVAVEATGPIGGDSRQARRRKRTKRSRSLWLGSGAVVVVVVGVAVWLSTGSGPPPASAAKPAGLVVDGLNMPSPFVYADGSQDYLYTGGYNNDTPPHVPVRQVSSLANLPAPTDALPTLPPGSGGWIWTVDVTKAASGYAMWMTTQYPAKLNPSGVPNQCITNATSASPLGPFTPAGGPVICQRWGSIDPRTVTAPDGTTYLIWKSDLNADHAAPAPTTIWEQRLAPDGVTLMGTAHQIGVSTQPWEQGLAESPDMVDLGGTYYLFFSGNSSESPHNGVGMMTCAGIQGPCRDTRTTPFLASNAQGRGPGEESLYQQNGDTWLLYSPNAIFGPYLYRPLAVARVAVGANGPYVASFDGVIPG